MPLQSTRGAGSVKGFGFSGGSPFIVATGGTVTTDGDFKIHTFTAIFLSALFPSMFNNNNSILECLYYTFATHIIVVEPLYYLAHYFLHLKTIYNKTKL